MQKAIPLIPWIGGKRRLAKRLLPVFPDHSCYVEPFCGAAALFFMKDPVDAEVLNDINGDLVSLYRVVKHHPEEFLRQFQWELSSRQMYDWAKVDSVGPLTDIQRAARFYYLQKLGFGGKVEGRTFGTATTSRPRLNLQRIEDDLSAAHHRLSRVFIEHLEWSECIRRYDRPHTLFYCDPPYWGTEGYGVGFELEEYDRMAELARSIEGRMVITVNDIPEMRKAFAGLRMETADIQYTVGGSARSSPSKELIILNH